MPSFTNRTQTTFEPPTNKEKKEELAHISKIVSDKKSELIAIKKDLSKTSDELNKAAEQRSLVGSSEAELSILENKKHELTTDLSILNGSIVKQKKELDTLIEKTVAVEAKKESLEASIVSLQNQIVELKDKISSINLQAEKQARTLTVELASLEEQKASLSDGIIQLQHEISVLEETEQHTKNAIAQLIVSNKKLTDQEAVLLNKIKQSEEELAKLGAQKEKTVSDIAKQTSDFNTFCSNKNKELDAREAAIAEKESDLQSKIQWNDERLLRLREIKVEVEKVHGKKIPITFPE